MPLKLCSTIAQSDDNNELEQWYKHLFDSSHKENNILSEDTFPYALQKQYIFRGNC